MGAPNSRMDALSEILRHVGLTGGVFLDSEFTEPWAVAGKVAPEACGPFMATPQAIVGFHYVAEGGFEIALDGEPVCRVPAGQAVMLPRNDLHVMGSSARLRPISIGELMQPPNRHGVATIRYGGGGARTRVVCGLLGGNEQLRPLLSELPPVFLIEVASLPGGDWIGRTFTYAAQTFADGEPGAASVLAKVSEVLFLESVRRHLANLPEGATGWLAGLRDPVIGRALSRLHAEAGRPWTAEALAREVNMSRSAFADRFTALVGQPPMKHLTGWRMQLARRKLLETPQPIAQIAFDVGYESEAAFTRAFRREQGAPPAIWRKLALEAAGR
jgi:AraC-like DNA-binding protein